MRPEGRTPGPELALLTLLTLGAVACDSAPTLEWSVVAGPGVDAESIEFVQARITRGACAAAGELVWSGEVRRDGAGARLSSPGNLGDGAWCFAVVGGASDCAEIAVGQVERTLPAEREPIEVVLAPSPAPCVPVMDAGMGEDAGVGADGGPDAGTPPPVGCWPAPLPEFPPPPPDDEVVLYRALRLPLAEAEFCPTTFSEAVEAWGDALCAEQLREGFVWSDLPGVSDACVEAARYNQAALTAPTQLTLVSHPRLPDEEYRACNVDFFETFPFSASGSNVSACLPNTAANPVALLCERPASASREVADDARTPAGTAGERVDAIYDPESNRYLIVYVVGGTTAGGTLRYAFVEDYGRPFSPRDLVVGESETVVRYPRVARGETEGGDTRFAVLWEEEGGAVGGPQRFVVLDGDANVLVGPEYLVDPEMHEFRNVQGGLGVAWDPGRREFLLVGLAARQSEPDTTYGKLQLRRARLEGDGVTLSEPVQLDSPGGAPFEGFFTESQPSQVVFHPTRAELLVVLGSDVLVIPSGADAPSSERVVAAFTESPARRLEVVALEGGDGYLAALANRVGRLDATGSPMELREWVSSGVIDGLLYFPPDGPGAMAGQALVQRERTLGYVSDGGEPCYPTSPWSEYDTSDVAIVVRNTETGGFARFWYDQTVGLLRDIFLSNGERY